MRRFLRRTTPPLVWFLWGAWVAFAAFWVPGGAVWSWGRITVDLPWTLSWLAVAAVLVTVGVARLRGGAVRKAADLPLVAHRALYAALLALPRAADGYAWLNRDAHLVFIVQRHPRLHLINVTQIDEGDVHAIREEGSAHLVARTWQVVRWSPDVTRRTDGAVVTQDDLDTGRDPFPRRRFPGSLRADWQARKAGLLYATTQELDELTRLLADVELLRPEDL